MSLYRIKIKELRLRLGLSQTEFAHKIGVSRSYIAQIEGGKSEPSISLLKNITKTFELFSDYFLDDYKTIEENAPLKEHLNTPLIKEALGEWNETEELGLFERSVFKANKLGDLVDSIFKVLNLSKIGAEPIQLTIQDVHLLNDLYNSSNYRSISRVFYKNAKKEEVILQTINDLDMKISIATMLLTNYIFDTFRSIKKEKKDINLSFLPEDFVIPDDKLH